MAALSECYPAFVVRHQLLAIDRAVDADVCPSEIIVGFAEAPSQMKVIFVPMVELERRFGAAGKEKTATSCRPQCLLELLNHAHVIAPCERAPSSRSATPPYSTDLSFRVKEPANAKIWQSVPHLEGVHASMHSRN
jgi:hypothetical protein